MISRRDMHNLLWAGITIKGFFAVVDLVTAFVLMAVGRTQGTHALVRFAHAEISDARHDFLIRGALSLIEHGTITTFVIVYLLGHGLINGVFVVGLLKHKRWAYPVSLVALTVFALYQSYRLLHIFSPWLLLFTFFDIAMIVLISYDYERDIHARRAIVVTE